MSLGKLLAFLSRPAVWITAISLTWATLLVSHINLVPQLRAAANWTWGYQLVLDPRRIAPLLVGMGLYVFGALWLVQRRSAAGLLAWAMAGCVGLSLSAAYIRGDLLYRFYTITVSGLAEGWHMAAAQIDNLPATLRRWPQFMGEALAYSSHVSTSPPGIVVVYYTANTVLEHLPALASALAQPLRWLQCQNIVGYTQAEYASAWLGMLTPLWSSLTIFPLYALGRSVFGATPARWSVVWWPLVPSLLMFTPLPNTFYPLPSLLMVLLLWHGLRHNQAKWVLAAGALMSVMTFMIFTLIPLFLLAGWLTLGIYALKRTGQPLGRLPWYWPVQMGLWFGLGLSVTWLIYYSVSGQGFWNFGPAIGQGHLSLDRPYWPNLVVNLTDFLMFTGWPLTFLAGLGLWAVVKKVWARQRLIESDIMIASAALALFILDATGIMRGETGRLLSFLSPWLLLTAAVALGSNRRLGRLITLVQAVCAVALILSARVLDSEFNSPGPAAPPEPTLAAPKAESLPSGAEFGGLARLNSYSGAIQAPSDNRPALVVQLDWQALRSIDTSYFISLIPVAPDGEAGSATLVQPFQNFYPMTCWRPGEGELSDRIEVPLPKAQSGDWWVSLRLIEGETGKTLEVVTPDGASDQQVGLGPFQ